MQTAISTQTVSFHDTQLITFKKDDIIYTAVRPIVEAMGLEWSGQVKKLSNPKFSCVDMYTTGKDGKTYQMLCMPLRKLNGWLFSINPEKVRSDLKAKVIQYQEECFEVLFNYWNKGVAVNPRAIKLTDSQQRKLANKVRSVCQNDRKRYPIVWNGLKEKFGVERYSEILSSDFDKAMAQVDIIAKSNFTDDNPVLVEQPFFLSQNMAREFDARLKHIFDLAELTGDSKASQLMKGRITALHDFLCAYQKQHYPNNLPALP